MLLFFRFRKHCKRNHKNSKLKMPTHRQILWIKKVDTYNKMYKTCAIAFTQSKYVWVRQITRMHLVEVDHLPRSLMPKSIILVVLLDKVACTPRGTGSRSRRDFGREHRIKGKRMMGKSNIFIKDNCRLVSYKFQINNREGNSSQMIVIWRSFSNTVSLIYARYIASLKLPKYLII